MSFAVYLLVALGFAAGTWILRGRATIAAAVGVAGLLASVVAAIAIRPGETLTIGASGFAATAYLRLFLILASVVGLCLAIGGFAARTRRDLPAVTLITLVAAALTLGLTDPRIAVVAGTIAGLVGAVLAVTPGGDRIGASVGIRNVRAVAVAGTMAIAATAWIGRDLSQLDAPPVVFGLAYLAMAVAIAIRFGAIPFHAWAARLTDTVPEAGLPIATIVASAPFAIAGLGWVEASLAPRPIDLGNERGVVLAIAVASIVLAAIAALIQDDLEHIVGYSIVGDAGVVLLALVALDPDGWGAARTWILALVATRSAFAAWAGAVRAAAGTGRIVELRGWATRSPLLLVGFGLVVVAAIGLPGFAAFEARSSLVSMAIDGPLASIVFVATFLPVAYYGRLLSFGFGRPDGPREPARDWRPRVGRIDLTALPSWWATTWTANRSFTSAALAACLGAFAVATSGGLFGSPEAVAEPAPYVIPAASAAPTASGDLFVPAPSAEPSFVPVPTE